MFYASPVELKLRYIYFLIDHKVYQLYRVNFFALYCQVIYLNSASIVHLTWRGLFLQGSHNTFVTVCFRKKTFVFQKKNITHRLKINVLPISFVVVFDAEFQQAYLELKRIKSNI